MRYVSTRGQSPPTDLATAVFDGLAPDGGLYVPERLEPLPAETLSAMAGASLAEIGELVCARFLEEIPAEERRSIVRDALDFDTPLVPLEDGIHVLELFHGPTLAFKDVGARFMARLMATFRKNADDSRPMTVLVATSGDTGSAVGHAFLGVPGTRVAVLYPEGQVSELQECQFTTLGGNVQALAVHGTFDDCQRLVKTAFGDGKLRGAMLLTSANSINVARLLPQSFYYFRAAAQLPSQDGPALTFATPSGNFGNLTAGLFAQQLGLRCAPFVAATNANDVVPEYLESGLFLPRPSVRTLSNAMDVGNPSNFDRIQWLYGGDLERIRRHLVGSRHDDGDTAEAIREVYQRTGYLLDPHTAVGYLGLKGALHRHPESPGIVLATAHPAKFRDVVEPLIGREVPLPERLARCLERPRQVLPLEPQLPALEEFLLSWKV